MFHISVSQYCYINYFTFSPCSLYYGNLAVSIPSMAIQNNELFCSRVLGVQDIGTSLSAVFLMLGRGTANLNTLYCIRSVPKRTNRFDIPSPGRPPCHRTSIVSGTKDPAPLIGYPENRSRTSSLPNTLHLGGTAGVYGAYRKVLFVVILSARSPLYGIHRRLVNSYTSLDMCHIALAVE